MGKVSVFLSTNTRERIKSLILGVVGTVVAGIYNLIKEGVFPTTFEQIRPSLLLGLGFGMLYITTTWLTPANPNALEKALKKE